MHLLVDSTGVKVCGFGEWLVEKHGVKIRRSWHKLHIGLDADTSQIVAAMLTTKEVSDGFQVGPLLDQVAATVASFTADGACDQEGVAATVAERWPEAAIIVPPRYTAVPSEAAETEPRSRTALCKASPSTDARPGRKHPATRSELGPRWPSAGSSRSSVTGCARARTGAERPRWTWPSMRSTVCWSWDARSPSASPEQQPELG